jgi:hypothetical protein
LPIFIFSISLDIRYYHHFLLEVASDFISVRIKEKTGLIAVTADGKLARPEAIFNMNGISHILQTAQL